MPRFRFTEDFDFSPAALGGRVTTAYKAGMVKTVTSECSELALAAGKGEIVKRTKDDGEEK